jgi:hypothetical protein
MPRAVNLAIIDYHGTLSLTPVFGTTTRPPRPGSDSPPVASRSRPGL